MLTIEKLRLELHKVTDDANAAAKSSDNSLAEANIKVLSPGPKHMMKAIRADSLCL